MDEQENKTTTEPVVDDLLEPSDDQFEGFGGSGDDEDVDPPVTAEPAKVDPPPVEVDPPADAKPEGNEPAKVDPPPAPPAPPAAKVEPPPVEKTDDEKLEQMALEKFKATYKEEYDPFNTGHQVKFIRTVRSIEREEENRNNEAARIQRDREALANSITQVLDTQDAQAFADELFLDLPTRESEKIKNALASGDTGPFLDFCKKAAKDFSTRGKAAEKVNEVKKKNTTPPPPVLEGSGGRGEAGGASDDSMDQLAGFGLS